MNIEDIKEAIEVLEDASAEMLMETGDKDYYSKAIAVLRQAIEQAEHVHAGNTSQERVDETAERKHMTDLARVGEVGVWGEREWVSLTDEEVSEVIDNVLEGGGWLDVARAIEAAIRRKNA